jgi:hypothetical protein
MHDPFAVAFVRALCAGGLVFFAARCGGILFLWLQSTIIP